MTFPPSVAQPLKVAKRLTAPPKPVLLRAVAKFHCKLGNFCYATKTMISFRSLSVENAATKLEFSEANRAKPPTNGMQPPARSLDAVYTTVMKLDFSKGSAPNIKDLSGHLLCINER